jgi:hypothetical protein
MGWRVDVVKAWDGEGRSHLIFFHYFELIILNFELNSRSLQ